MVLSSEMTSSETDSTSERPPAPLICLACRGCHGMSFPLSIRNGHVSIVKHTFGIYATVAYLFLLGPVPAHAAEAWKPDVEAAATYAAARAGTVSFAVRTERRAWGRDATRAVPAASVLKVMLLVAYLRRPEVRERPLRDADRALLGRWCAGRTTWPPPECAASWATPASCAWRGGPACAASARPPVWGLSSVDAADQSRFLLHVERLVPRRHRRTAHAPARLDRALAALGDRARAARRLGALLQGRLGLGQRRGGPPGGAPSPRRAADGGGDHDHVEPQPRVREGHARGRGPSSAARPRAGFDSRGSGWRARVRRHGSHALAVRGGLPRRAAGLARRQPSGRGPARRRRRLRAPPRLAEASSGGRLRGLLVAEGVRRPRRHARGAGALRRGDGARQGAQPRQRAGDGHGRAGGHRPRRRHPEGALAARRSSRATRSGARASPSPSRARTSRR